LFEKREKVPSVTSSPRQKKRLYIVVLNFHKHNCLFVLFMLVDVFSLTSSYRFYVGRPVVKRLLVLFMLVDAFSLTIYYRLYVGHPVVLYSTIK